MAKKKTDNCQQSQKLKTNEKCFNYRIKRHYARNCHLGTLKRKLKDKNITKKAKQA